MRVAVEHTGDARPVRRIEAERRRGVLIIDVAFADRECGADHYISWDEDDAASLACVVYRGELSVANILGTYAFTPETDEEREAASGDIVQSPYRGGVRYFLIPHPPDGVYEVLDTLYERGSEP